MGAGSIGCYLGACLQAAGVEVHYIGRPRIIEALRSHDMLITDIDGNRFDLPCQSLKLHYDIPLHIQPLLVLLCVKSGATVNAAEALDQRLPAGTLVVSMQNGLSNASKASNAAPRLTVLPGMVPFNVAQISEAHFHRGTSGKIAVQRHEGLVPWLPWFKRAGLPLDLQDDMGPVQWGKLLLNLNNPVNALSGLPLQAQLLSTAHRRMLADLMDEALGLLNQAGIRPARFSPLPWALLPVFLRLPTPLFRTLARGVLNIDASARSSMADDVLKGRPTEIDEICGEFVRLAKRFGTQAPKNEEMMHKILELQQTVQH
jgi:2-dehydropantoate 2-reductase